MPNIRLSTPPLDPGETPLLMLGNAYPNGDGFEASISIVKQDPMGVYVGNSLIAGDGIVTVNGMLIINGLPTSDPQLAGAIWNDQGTLKVSAGQ